MFLYQLLGWSAFAGFVVIPFFWPLNSMIARRSIEIQKGVMAARDKRMGVLNELISAVSRPILLDPRPLLSVPFRCFYRPLLSSRD